ncbi:MAG: class I SAM-dependent methyltransferase [Chloroflexota bacterium]
MITISWFPPLLIFVLVVVIIVFISKMGPMLVGAQYVPTPMNTARRMLKLADVQHGETVYDLGSGDGRLLMIAVQEFGAKAFGVEIDPFRYALTRLKIKWAGLDEMVTVKRGNLFDVDLRDADVVMIYLLPKANAKLAPKLLRELKPTARVVCHAFPIPNWKMAKVDDELMLYRRNEQ